ncbi:MAG: ribonuclease E inhibitor RraB [Gemmatimonadales bacterium]
MSLAFLLALGLLGLGLLLNGRRRAAHDTAHPDATTLTALTRAGSDLSQVHDLEFYLYLPTESAAAHVAETLRADGFATQVEPDPEPGGHEWLCLATRQMAPHLAELERLRGRLSSLASAAGGEYDGWGATVVAPPKRG